VDDDDDDDKTKGCCVSCAVLASGLCVRSRMIGCCSYKLIWSSSSSTSSSVILRGWGLEGLRDIS